MLCKQVIIIGLYLYACFSWSLQCLPVTVVLSGPLSQLYKRFLCQLDAFSRSAYDDLHLLSDTIPLLTTLSR